MKWYKYTILLNHKHFWQSLHMLPIHNCIVASISVSHAYAVINIVAQQVAKCIEQSTKNHSLSMVYYACITHALSLKRCNRVGIASPGFPSSVRMQLATKSFNVSYGLHLWRNKWQISYNLLWIIIGRIFLTLVQTL